MNKYLALLLCIAIPLLTAARAIDVQTAVQDGMLECFIKGNDDSPHYGKPVRMDLKNVSAKPIEIRIPNGLQLASVESGTQDVIVVRELLVKLSPGEREEVELNAMCTQHMNGGPSDRDDYAFKGMAAGNLLAMAGEIERTGAFNTLGQYAVWHFTDGHDLAGIAGYNRKQAEGLQKFICGLTGAEMPEYDETDYLQNYEDPWLMRRKYSGFFSFTFSHPTPVQVAMFDEENRLVRELYNNPLQGAGSKRMEYAFDASVYTNDKYYIRMIMNQEIVLELEVEN